MAEPKTNARGRREQLGRWRRAWSSRSAKRIASGSPKRIALGAVLTLLLVSPSFAAVEVGVTTWSCLAAIRCAGPLQPHRVEISIGS
jgi:hypothetical protein